MNESRVTIVRSQPTVYINETGQPVNGFLVTVKFNNYNETHEIRVPNMDVNTIKPVIAKLLDDRDSLAELTL